MLIKAYLKSNMFHLPIAHDELIEQIKEQLFSDKELVPSAIGKLYPIQKIEGNKNIIIEKQRTNIFLLNFLLLVMYEKDIAIEEEHTFNNNFIIEQLEELTALDLSNGYEDLEGKMIDYLSNKNKSSHSDNTQIPLNETVDTTDTQETEDTNNALQKVIFNMEWVKQAHNKLK